MIWSGPRPENIGLPSIDGVQDYVHSQDFGSEWKIPERYRGQHIRLKRLFRVETHYSLTFGSD